MRPSSSRLQRHGLQSGKRLARLAVAVGLILAGDPTRSAIGGGLVPNTAATGVSADSVGGSTTPSAMAAASDSGASSPPETQIPQRDVIDLLAQWILGRRVEPKLEGTSKTGLSWTILPTLSYNPVYGFAFGASASGAGVLGTRRMSRYSVMSLSGNYSTTGQLQLQFRCDVYSPSGNYLVKADVRYLDTKRSTWGLGPFDSQQGEFPMEFNLIRAYGTMYRRISGPVYFGIGYHYDEFGNIVDSHAVAGVSTPFSEYSGPGVTRTRASGVSINLLGDTRDNLVNPTRGYYLSGTFRNYPSKLGSDNNWQEYWLDVRLYPRLPPSSHNVLAFWIYNWYTFGKAPYLNLPAIGWDTYGRGGRGYLQGRIRGEDQMYFETEYRMQLTRDGLLGAVCFFNLTVTSLPDTKTFGKSDHAVGVGLRLKFNKHSNTNLSLDHGWGEGHSKGWFMGMTEVF